jgi:hypothetical protein
MKLYTYLAARQRLAEVLEGEVQPRQRGPTFPSCGSRSTRINVVAATEERSKQLNLGLSRGVSIDDHSEVFHQWLLLNASISVSECATQCPNTRPRRLDVLMVRSSQHRIVVVEPRPE